MATQAGEIAYAASPNDTTVLTVRLAETLVRTTPGDLSRVFCSGSAKAVETAMMIATRADGLRKTYSVGERLGLVSVLCAALRPLAVTAAEYARVVANRDLAGIAGGKRFLTRLDTGRGAGFVAADLVGGRRLAEEALRAVAFLLRAVLRLSCLICGLVHSRLPSHRPRSYRHVVTVQGAGRVPTAEDEPDVRNGDDERWSDRLARTRGA